MEGGGKQISLLKHNGRAFVAGKNFDAAVGSSDARGADEDGGKRFAGESWFIDGEFGFETFELVSVGVSFDGGVEKFEAAWFSAEHGLLDFFGEKNGTGTGSPHGERCFSFFNRIKNTAFGEQFSNGRRFTAWQNEPVNFIDLLRFFHGYRLYTNGAQTDEVLLHRALNIQHADGERVSCFSGF